MTRYTWEQLGFTKRASHSLHRREAARDRRGGEDTIKFQKDGVGWGRLHCVCSFLTVLRSPFINVSQFSLAVRREAGTQRDLGSNPLRLSFLFKGCGLWTLSCDFVPHNYETLKRLSSLPTLMQKSFWW